MAITSAQRNAGYRQLVLAAVTEHPPHADRLLKLIIFEVKNGVTQTQRDIAKAIANEIVENAYSYNPVGNHRFRHLLYDIIQNEQGDLLTIDDVFDAESILVI